MALDLTVTFEADGSARFLYDDDLAAVAAMVGGLTVRRASHVEPTADGRWTADMAPVLGPVLGPYDTRKEALDAERQWLIEHGIPVPKENSNA